MAAFPGMSRVARSFDIYEAAEEQSRCLHIPGLTSILVGDFDPGIKHLMTGVAKAVARGNSGYGYYRSELPGPSLPHGRNLNRMRFLVKLVNLLFVLGFNHATLEF